MLDLSNIMKPKPLGFLEATPEFKVWAVLNNIFNRRRVLFYWYFKALNLISIYKMEINPIF